MPKNGNNADQTLRRAVVDLLAMRGAHADFERALAGLPAKLRGALLPEAEHTLWQLLEHMRIAQWDILEFSRNPKHVSPEWPEGYWPPTPAPPNPAAWTKSVQQFRDDLAAMQQMITDPKSDLFTPFPYGDGQTLLREALLVADHNAYHLGQFILVRRLLGAWK